MAGIIHYEPSRTLMEFRLLPRLTTPETAVDRVSLETNLVWGPEGEPGLRLRVPVTASAMQSVSGERMAIELARLGGAAFIYCSQDIESQAAMVRTVKGHLTAGRESARPLPAAAAVNTHDYQSRVPALVAAGVDVVAVDSSDGHSFYQTRAIEWISRRYSRLPVIGGNVITGDGFDYLAGAGARAVKVGMGGGSICITQEQKGTGRGLATSIIKVAEARDRHRENTGRHLPIIADGGIGTAKDIVVALALGADCVMMGRYFAGMDESPSPKVTVDGRVMKPYWGEGSARARDWKNVRYHQDTFVEGVEGFVPCTGRLEDNLETALAKIRSSLSSCGCSTVEELRMEAELEVVSALSIREGQVHDIYVPPEAPHGSSTDCE